jgi:hypothetical protein
LEAIAGVFQTRTDAERALNQIRNAAIPEDRITLLTPGSVDQIHREVESVAVDSTEQPGMGGAMGALLGGGIGVTSGSLLMALVPGVGPITAFGLLGAAVLGAAGATVGAKAGNRIEQDSDRGLPEDEIFVYEDALRRGRSVVIAMAENGGQADLIRDLFKREGAESVDAAREQWWIGLRSAEANRYPSSGRAFSDDERFYRMGFEAAMHARTRCMEFDQVSAAMDAALEDVKHKYPGEPVEEPFTRGYRRGREHYQQLCEEGSRRAA